VAPSEPDTRPPPLTILETRRIVGRLDRAADEHDLVLIGGQAIALARTAR
jgi:hypothetical protein